jgi:hypothetical protein
VKLGLYIKGRVQFDVWKGVLRIMYGPKRDEVTGGCRK